MEEEEEEVGEVTHISTSILVETEGKYNLAEVARRFVGEADGRAAMTVLRGRLWAAGQTLATMAVVEVRVRNARRCPCWWRTGREGGRRWSFWQRLGPGSVWLARSRRQ